MKITRLFWRCALLLMLTAGAVWSQAPTMLDGTFAAGMTIVPNGDVLTIVADREGRLLAGGQFTKLGTVDHNHLVRLDANGTPDGSFFVGTGANNFVYAVAVQPDGRILIGGSFTKVNGQGRTYLARLDASGNLDPDFVATTIDNEIRAIALDSAGRILIAGRFTMIGNLSRNRVARLKSDGSPDPDFDPGTGANDNVRAMICLGDDRILIGGQFTAVNQVNRGRLARLNTDGSLDRGFAPGSGADGMVRTINTNRDGTVAIGGEFQS